MFDQKSLKLDDVINDLIFCEDVTIRRLLQSHYDAVNVHHSDAVKSRCYSYSAVIRNHLLNAHTYIRLGEHDLCLAEIANAKAVIVKHNKADQVRFDLIYRVFDNILTNYYVLDVKV